MTLDSGSYTWQNIYRSTSPSWRSDSSTSTSAIYFVNASRIVFNYPAQCAVITNIGVSDLVINPPGLTEPDPDPWLKLPDGL